MKLFGRRRLRVLSPAALSLVLLATAAPATHPAAKPALPAGELPSANAKSEPRLRKLHLVRPDLIPYPIAYEVYC